MQVARFCSTKGAMALNFTEKAFTNSHKTAKFAKVFSLESFPLYSIEISGLHRQRKIAGRSVIETELCPRNHEQSSPEEQKPVLVYM